MQKVEELSKGEVRMVNIFISLATTYMVIYVPLFLTKTLVITAILRPKSLYYTPGLWEMSGLAFWRAFLFETPFALGRGLGLYLFPCLIILYIIFAVKANIYYKKITSDIGYENH